MDTKERNRQEVIYIVLVVSIGGFNVLPDY
jgi:hypothetical protein